MNIHEEKDVILKKSSYLKSKILVWDVVRPTRVRLLDFCCSGIRFYVLLNPYLYFISFFIS